MFLQCLLTSYENGRYAVYRGYLINSFSNNETEFSAGSLDPSCGECEGSVSV